MNNKSEYNHIICNYTPYMCKPIQYSIVISESLLDWYNRQSDKYVLMQIIFTIKIDKLIYNTNKQHNPSNTSYAKLLDCDYYNTKVSKEDKSEYINDDDDFEDCHP